MGIKGSPEPRKGQPNQAARKPLVEVSSPVDKRTMLISAVLFAVIGTIVLAFWYKPGARKQMVKRTEQLAKDMNGITQPATTMMRNFVPALPLSAKRPVRELEIRSVAPRPAPSSSRTGRFALSGKAGTKLRIIVVAGCVMPF